MPIARRHIVPTALAALSLVAATRCEECGLSNGIFGLSPAGDARGAWPDRYAAFTTKKDTGSGGAYGTAPFLLRPPYRASVTFGLFDPASVPIGDGASGCLTLQSEDLVSVFHSICATYDANAGGMHVEATSQASPLFLDGATLADVQLEANGSTVVFSGRAVGAPDWTPIGVAPLPATLGLLFGVSASYIPAGAVVGFDDAALDVGLPSDPTPEETAADPTLQALSRQLAAASLAYDDPIDVAGALAELDASAVQLQAGRAAALALGTKDGKKAAKKLAGAVKKLAKARAKVAAQDLDGAYKQLQSVGKAELQGLDALLP